MSITRREFIKYSIITSAALFGLGCIGGSEKEKKENITPTPTETPSEWIPEKEIQLIIPYKAGGGTDIYARIVAPYWEKYLPGDQPIVIINKLGGGGVVGTTAIYQAKPDGYTIGLIIPLAMIINQLTKPEVQYDVLKMPVLGSPSAYTRVVCTNPKTVPDIENWDDLLERIYDLTFATYGFGGTAHLAPLLTGYESGLYDPRKLHFVHYSGTSGVIAAFERKEADVYFGAVEAHTAYRNEVFNFILVFKNERHEMCPDVPTTVEVGIPNAEKINNALTDIKAFVAPPETPAFITNTLASSLNKAMNDPLCIKEAKEKKRPITPRNAKESVKLVNEMFKTWSKQDEIIELLKTG